MVFAGWLCYSLCFATSLQQKYILAKKYLVALPTAFFASYFAVACAYFHCIMEFWYFFIFVVPFIGSPGIQAEAHVLSQHQWWLWSYTVNWLLACTGDWFTFTPPGNGRLLVSRD